MRLSSRLQIPAGLGLQQKSVQRGTIGNIWFWVLGRLGVGLLSGFRSVITFRLELCMSFNTTYVRLLQYDRKHALKGVS